MLWLDLRPKSQPSVSETSVFNQVYNFSSGCVTQKKKRDTQWTRNPTVHYTNQTLLYIDLQLNGPLMLLWNKNDIKAGAVATSTFLNIVRVSTTTKNSIKGTKKRTFTENCKFFFFKHFPRMIAHIMHDVTYELLHFHKVLDNT